MLGLSHRGDVPPAECTVWMGRPESESVACGVLPGLTEPREGHGEIKMILVSFVLFSLLWGRHGEKGSEKAS